MRRLAIVAAIVMLLGLAFACTGDDSPDPTIEAYFAGFERITQDVGPRARAVFTETARFTPLPKDAPDDQRVAHARRLYEQILSIQLAGLDRFRELDPPPEVADAHQLYLDATEASSGWLESLLSSERFEDYILGNDTGTSEVDRALEEFGLDAELILRAIDACEELAQFASDNDIDVDLDCRFEDQ